MTPAVFQLPPRSASGISVMVNGTAPLQIDLLELFFLAKGDPLAIGRPERRGRILGIG